MKIFISGIGIVSAIGNNYEENFSSLVNKKHGIGKITNFDTIFKDEIPVGEVKLTKKELAKKIGIEYQETYTRTTLLGMLAAQEAIKSAKISNMSEHKTAFISATTGAGMLETETFYNDFVNSDFKNEYVKTHEAGDSTEKIAEFIGATDLVTTISTACSSSANAIMHGARLIKNGIVKRAIVGGVDAMSKFTLNGFNTLKILDREHCKPFDKDRQGLNLGEAAAFLVLESEEIFNKKYAFAELTGYANANDAYHQTASSPEGKGAYMAMKQAIELAKISPKDINYINVHGTGTNNNDLSEGTAITRLFEGKIPKFSSTKAYTGHTLAAAGAVEAIFSILAIRNSIIFPNLNFKNKIEEFDMIPETEVRGNYEINHVLSNSFGFGGNGTALVISKYNKKDE